MNNPKKITEPVVLKVAKLAHLKLNQQEVEHYTEQMTKILSYVDQLETLKITDSTAIPADAMPEAKDAVIHIDVIHDALKQAPAHTGTAFQVPRIIE